MAGIYRGNARRLEGSHDEVSTGRLRKVEIEADQYGVNGYSEIERDKLNLINSTYRNN